MHQYHGGKGTVPFGPTQTSGEPNDIRDGQGNVFGGTRGLAVRSDGQPDRSKDRRNSCPAHSWAFVSSSGVTNITR